MQRCSIARPLFVVLVACALLIAPATSVAAPDLQSSDGITVKQVRDVTKRTFDISVGTTAVSGMAVPFGNNVRVTVPADYATSGKRYPVLYLLHFLGGNYTSWSTFMQVEGVTAKSDVITVMPEGGVGWYTNWTKQTNGAQNWETYHLDQLIPFIDHNLRTIATREGRGIAGISMGGYGAVHYAEDRPDLFSSVTSLSGVTELNLPTMMVIAGSSMIDLAAPFSAFGAPLGRDTTAWAAANPVFHAAALADTDYRMYVGGNPFDPVETVVHAGNTNLARALRNAGVPYTYVQYGLGGSIRAALCFGIHQPGCWNPAFRDAFPHIMARLAPAVAAS